jgi:hypothetical protein
MFAKVFHGAFHPQAWLVESDHDSNPDIVALEIKSEAALPGA